MDPRLKPYYLSKWICETHGHFTARTVLPASQAFPVHCPQCQAKLVDQTKVMTVLPVPFVSMPRIPKKTDTTPSASNKAPLRKRGVSW